jgi:methyl-accepting chemotaxis protein
MKLRWPNFKNIKISLPAIKKDRPLQGKIFSIRGINPVKSIGMRLFLYFFLVIVIGVAGVGFISYGQSNAVIQQEISESKRLTAIQASKNLSLVLNKYEELSMEIVLIPEMEQLASQIKLDPDNLIGNLNLREKIDERLNGYLFTDSYILSIHLISADPRMPSISVGAASATVETAVQSEWYKRSLEANGKGSWVDTAATGPSGRQGMPAFGFARLIKSQSSMDPLFVLLIEMKEERLQDVIGGALGEDSTAYIIGSNGTVVSSPVEEQLAKSSALPLAGDSSKGAVSVEPVDGRELLIAHAVVSGTDWKIVGVQSFDKLIAGTKKILTLTWIMIGCSVLAAVLIGWIIVLQIGRPLRNMSALLKQAAAGDLSVQSRHTGRSDEIGTLAESFNGMIGNIRALVGETNASARQVLDTASELSEASKRTATSAKEISIATEQIALGASSVAVEAERVTDVTSIMGTKMQHTIEANEQMSNAAADIRKSSELGKEYMVELSRKTSETEKLTLSMVRKVEDLQQSTASIRDILKLLNNITKQTNILSLNATIEAVRAGEAGRGFKVVADEIRMLAEQSKQSIETVGQITDRIRHEIEDTVVLMGQAYPMFQEQIVSVKQSNEIFVTVNDRMGEFVDQLGSVTDAVMQLEETQRTLAEAMSSVSAVAQESSATTEQVASLSSDQLQIGDSLVGLASRLEDVSHRLRETLNKFRL